jgi:uncharacterized protein YuzE
MIYRVGFLGKRMNNKPKLVYDSKSDVLYIAARKGKEEEFVEIAPGINVELDEKGEVIGIEILNASNFLRPIAKPLYQHMQIA